MAKPSIVVPLALLTAAIIFCPDMAQAAVSGPSNGLPWETPLLRVQESIRGPVAYAFSLLGIIVAGAALVFGGEINEFVRRVIMLVMVVSLIMFAANILSSLFMAGAVVL